MYSVFAERWNSMESTLRGILEKEIESFTHPNVLRNFITLFQMKNIPTKSIEDTLFGIVVGYMFGRFAITLWGRHEMISIMTGQPINNEVRLPTDAEKKEFWEMIEKRTMYIKGRIKLETSR